MKSLAKTKNVLFCLILFFGLAATWKTASHEAGIDFYQFWAVGQSLHRADVPNIYSAADRAKLGAEFLERAKSSGQQRFASVAGFRKEFETYSSPFLYALFHVFSSGDYERDFRNYRILLIALLLFSVAVFARLCGHSWATTIGTAAIFGSWFPEFSSDLRVGNVNAIQLAALAAYLVIVTRLRSRWKDALGGAVFGLLLAFKPNLVFVIALLAVHWLLEGRMRRIVEHAIGGAAGLLTAFLFGSLSSGSLHCWTDWMAAVRSMPGTIITVDLGNYAPSRVVLEWLGFDPAIVLAVLVLAAALAVMVRTRKRARPDQTFDDLVVLAAGCLLVVLVPRLAWLHYFLLTIPALLVLLRPIETPAPSRGTLFWRRVVPVIALLGLTIEPIMNFGVDLSGQAAGVMIGGSTMLLLAAVLRERFQPVTVGERVRRPSA